ncbi:hypothetical protein ISX93_15050 [Pseudomonas sp. N040]|nr:hypothetical protein [Pseudomonas sp. N040]MBW7015035.1 hypothetical protein [Pseudomonas sp. N040]
MVSATALLAGIALRVAGLRLGSLRQANAELLRQNERCCERHRALQQEHRAIMSALRAEREHVQQLQRKTRLMALLLDELHEQATITGSPRA